MQDTRLDLEAPLLSVRRHSAQPAGNPSTKPEQTTAMKPLTPSWRPAFSILQFRAQIRSSEEPRVVPFVWEHEPGQPKADPDSVHRPEPAPLFPPGRTPNDREPNPIFQDSEMRQVNKPTETPTTVALAESVKVEEEDYFSNAVETLSCTESFFMNCSVSDISDAVEVSGTISTVPSARTLMMERFLPAAQAMAGSSTQCPPRKPSKMGNRFENGEHELRRSPLPYQHLPNFVARYPRHEIDSVEGDDDEYDNNNFEGNGHFTSKACGLLPRLCLKSSFCLLNPISGMKVGCWRRIPLATSRKIRSIMQSNIPLSEAEDEVICRFLPSKSEFICYHIVYQSFASMEIDV
ncbi:hypothetical protein KSP40_PGU013013 [Platanthera guangdongensis]|uniref:Uncharacterized protein n=1 Tax=Platanthera guangdongensis TaxID=2320717 RepID=A0ABR2LR58_9ASPA